MNLKYIFNDPQTQARIDRLRDLTILLKQRNEAAAELKVVIEEYLGKGNLYNFAVDNEKQLADLQNRAELVLDEFADLFRDQES